MTEIFVGRVERVQRLGHTTNGNPMHKVALYYRTSDNADFNFGIFRVSNDAMLNYEINNSEFRDELHEFHMTEAGRIAFARKIV